MNTLKIISLGGFGKVTDNMFVYETDKDIIIVDCGMGFPTEEMLGVDLLVPDASYLMTKKEKIRGIVLTHGHDDHIGALPYILPKLPEVPIFGSQWALALVKGKLTDFNIGARLEEVSSGSNIVLGDFKIGFIEVTHSIPETLHLVIRTPLGTIYHAPDFKLDLTPVMGKPTDQRMVAQVGNEGVLCLLSDCLRAEKAGFTPSEHTLEDVFEREIANCKGKFIVTTMSSNISRFKQAIDVSLRHGRKIALVGRSVEKNMDIAIKLGYLKYPSNNFVSSRHLDELSPSNLTLLVAGSQAQSGSALERIVAGEHDIKIEPEDKVVFSTDYIPGNEVAIYELVDNILKLGADVSYMGINSDVHVSGHGSSQDLKKLMELVHAKYLVPIGGNYRHMIAYQKLAIQSGYQKEKVLLPEDGQIIEFNQQGQVNLNNKIETGVIIVDALGVGDVGNVVLRDRKVLSEEGMATVIVVLNRATREVIGEPEILSRGFVYVKNSEALLKQASEEVKKIISSYKSNKISNHFIRGDIQEKLERFFFKKTGRRPMILSQIVEV